MIPLPPSEIENNANQRSNMTSYAKFYCSTGHSKFSKHSLMFLELALPN